jgi:16S rRNA G966 N2-methylase RsmD
MARLMRGIEAFGLVDPIIVNQATGNIVGGHQRVEAAKRLKLAQVPVVHVSLDRDQEKALNLALNKISGEWDLDALRDILGDLSGEGFDLDLTGFSADEVADLLAGDEVNGDDERELGDPDEVPEVDEQAPPVTKPGDLIVLGAHRLLCGDSTKAEDVARLMDGVTPSAIYTDPPYGIAYSGKGITANGVKGNDFGEIIGDGDVSVAREAFALADQLGAGLAIWWGANYYCDSLPPQHAWIVWDKEVVGDVYSAAEMAWTSKQGRTRMFRHMWHGMIKASEQGQARVHPTQKPVALAEWAFEQLAAGATVLDLFGGSGSTLIACESTNRAAYLMELDPRYCDVIVRRWELFTGKTAQRPEREAASGKPRQGRKAAV